MNNNTFSTGKILLVSAMIFCALPQNLSGQDLHLYYNLFSDSLYYLKDNKPVRRPKIGAGDRVVVHFTEFNTYLYKGSVTVEQVENASSGANLLRSLGSFSSLVPGLGSFLPNLTATSDEKSGELENALAASGSPTFDLPLLKLGEKTITLKDLLSGSRGNSAQLLNSAQAKLAELAQIQSEMHEIYQDIESIEQAETAALVAEINLERLCFDPNLRPSTIRKMSLEYFSLIFRKPAGEAVPMADVFDLPKIGVEKKELLKTLAAKKSEFEAKSGALLSVAQQLSDLDLGNETVDQFAGDLKKVEKQSKAFQEQLTLYLAKKQSDAAAGEGLSLQKALDLHLKMAELSDQKFSFESVVQIEKSTVNLTAEFTPLETLANGKPQTNNSPKSKFIKIETNRGLRIGTSFGFVLSRFSNPVSGFSVREGRIVAEKGSVFQPVIATGLHFYPEQRGSVKLAGLLGLGVPVSGGDLQNLQFVLGPSLLFGRNQSFVLSAGAAFGQVNRLAKNYAEGDAFDINLGDIPTRKVYEVGFFAGISFLVGRR